MTMPRAKARPKAKLPPYTSDSLAVSRRMVAAGPDHERRAILHDILSRLKNRTSLRRYTDRGDPYGDKLEREIQALRADAVRRLDAMGLPSDVRQRYLDEIWR